MDRKIETKDIIYNKIAESQFFTVYTKALKSYHNCDKNLEFIDAETGENYGYEFYRVAYFFDDNGNELKEPIYIPNRVYIRRVPVERERETLSMDDKIFDSIKYASHIIDDSFFLEEDEND